MRIDRQRNYNSVRKRIFRKVLISLFIIGVPILVFFILFGIKKADVVGESRYSDKQIREMVLKSKLDYNCVYLYLKYRFFVTPDIPFIEKLDVDINSNHEVTIYVYDKIVTGCVYIMGEYLYFDKDGIVVESSSEKIEKVPVIEGLKFNEIVLHEKLDLQNNDSQDDTQSDNTDAGHKDELSEEQNTGQKEEQDEEQNAVQKENQSEEQNAGQKDEQKDVQSSAQNDKLFDVILNLTKLINKYGLDVDIIRFDEEENVTLKCGGIKVLLGKKNDYYEALSDLKSILLEAKGTDLFQLDMREYDKDTNYVIGKSKNSTK